MAQIEQAKSANKSTKRMSAKLKAAVALPKQPKTKRDRLQARLEQVDGASLKQLEQEFGWLPHTVRAAISGLRKAGLEVQRGAGDTSSVYRIVATKAA